MQLSFIRRNSCNISDCKFGLEAISPGVVIKSGEDFFKCAWDPAGSLVVVLVKSRSSYFYNIAKNQKKYNFINSNFNKNGDVTSLTINSLLRNKHSHAKETNVVFTFQAECLRFEMNNLSLKLD